MQPLKLFYTLILGFLFSYPMISQDLYQGSFMTNDGLYGMQFKKVSKGFQGILVSYQGTFALEGERTKTGIKGKIYSEGATTEFTGEPMDGGWKIKSYGVDYLYYQVSLEHELDGVDLKPYLTTEPVKISKETAYTSQSSNQNTTPANTYKNNGVYGYVAGSQLVYYTRTSYVSSSSASTIVYINFCPDGRFTLNYDGGFSVEGSYGGNAHGASKGANSGRWEIVNAPNTNPAITLYYNNGETGSIYVTQTKLQSGRWKVANTQYALVRNKVSCQ